MKTRKKIRPSKRVFKDPDSVFGKNMPLEKFYHLLRANYVVVIYNDRKHKTIKRPNRKTQKYHTFFDNLDNDPNVDAILIAPRSWDGYELRLYPSAKTKSVEFVIKHYKTYFKPLVHPENTLKKLWCI